MASAKLSVNKLHHMILMPMMSGVDLGLPGKDVSAFPR